MFTQGLLAVSAAVRVLLLARLRQLGLIKRPFGAFSLMIITELLLYFVLMIPGFRTHGYTVLWELTFPVAVLTDALAGVSTYRAIADLYLGIGKFAVWLYTVSLVIAALACLAGLPFETRRIGGGEATLRTLILLNRWIHTLLAGGLVLAVAFLSYFPRPLKRMPGNLVLHTRLLCIYFCLYILLPLVVNLVPLGHAKLIENVQLCCVLSLYITWIFGLSKEGQKTEPWPQLSPETLIAIDEQNKDAVDLAKKAARGAMN